MACGVKFFEEFRAQLPNVWYDDASGVPGIEYDASARQILICCGCSVLPTPHRLSVIISHLCRPTASPAVSCENAIHRCYCHHPQGKEAKILKLIFGNWNRQRRIMSQSVHASLPIPFSLRLNANFHRFRLNRKQFPWSEIKKRTEENDWKTCEWIHSGKTMLN